MKLSIIVPVYNVEAYIGKCLRSLKINTYRDNIEVIIIDDCSTDDSLTLCEQFKADNVTIIKKSKNSGLSDSRNMGLRHSTGDYIMFLDSDDYVEEEYYSKIVLLAEKYNRPDVLYFGFFQEESGTSTPRFGFVSSKNRVYSRDVFLESELRRRKLYAAVWLGIYKREFLLRNNLLFKSGIFHEDELWTPQVLCKAETICTTDYLCYHYVKRDNSITTKKDRTQNGLDMLSICHELEKVLAIEDKRICRLMNNHLGMLYMKGVSEGLLYRKNKAQVDRLYPLRHVCKLPDIMKAVLFLVSLKGYCRLNKAIKK